MKRLPNFVRQSGVALLFGLMLLAVVGWSGAQDGKGTPVAGGVTVGIPWTGEPGISKTTAEIMALPPLQRPANFEYLRMHWEMEEPERENLPQAPGAIDASQWPLKTGSVPRPDTNPLAPQTIGLTFDGPTGPTETGAFPPDCMGAVGPSQFIVFLNGRIRSYVKTTGAADGVLNVDSDVFFASVVTPPGAGEISFTSDPNVRYDRLTGRWFLTIIDVTMNSTTQALTRPNRVLIAVSNGDPITAGTVWTFYQFQQDLVSPAGDTNDFADYPSLGIDMDAMYIGTDQFTLPGAFVNTTAFVIRKSSVLSGGPIVVTAFRNLIAGSGPFAPRGVDNFDATNTGPSAIGYIIGADNAAFSTLSIHRITNPGGTPVLSTNISVTTPLTTSTPVLVPHLGNTGGTSGRLDCLDDRLYAAHLRNGRLWTAHNIGVNNTGTTTGTRTRNAARWYELQNLTGTPSIVQSGTLYDSTSPNNTSQRNYWIPTVMVSGQGHVALGCSIAGTNEHINAFTTGRLSGDAVGTMRNGPGGSSLLGYTSTSFAYNPPSDPGGSSGRRWGDYSFVSLDPKDDMTMWTVQEYCNGTNTYSVRVAQLLAPPPATPASASPATVSTGLSSVDVIVTGTSVSGSGFYDPGTGFPNRISASVLAGVGATGSVAVNSVTYTDPTHVTLNLNTNGALGQFSVRVTNPDAQQVTSASTVLTVTPLPIQLATFTGSFVSGNHVRLNWTTISELNNYGFEIQKADQPNNYASIAGVFVPGHGTTNEPHQYAFVDSAVALESHWYRLKQIDLDGTVTYSDGILVSRATGVAEGGAPAEFYLSQNYPNPFNPSTEIKFSVEVTGRARLEVFNVVGQRVATLFDEMAVVGQYYKVRLDAGNFPSGVYLYRLQSGRKSELKKLVLLK